MTKRDFTYLKHTKHEIKRKEKSDRQQLSSKQLNAVFEVTREYQKVETEHTQLCRESARMTPRERLLNYFATWKGEYVGSGCNWDLLTKWGLKK